MIESLETSVFESRSSPPALSPGEVHLWLASLGPFSPQDLALLSSEEALRAERLVQERHRVRHIAAHATLRRILAGYIDEDPAALRFDRGPHGKPHLTDSLLRFNLSHSEDLMLVAVTSRREVGVDVEAIRSNVPFEMLAEHYFSPKDQWSLRILPEPARLRHFFEVWTRTEAELKALGVGLGGELSVDELNLLTIRSFEPAAGYAAALAVDGRIDEISCYQWLN